MADLEGFEVEDDYLDKEYPGAFVVRLTWGNLFRFLKIAGTVFVWPIKRIGSGIWEFLIIFPKDDDGNDTVH